MDFYHETVFSSEKACKARSLYSSNMEHIISVHPHWHSEVEILLFLEGCARQQVNDNFFTAEAGDVVIITEDQLHSTYSYKGIHCKILVLQFDAVALLGNDLNHNNKKLATYFANRIHYKNPLKTSTSVVNQLKICINEMNEELEKENSAYNILVGALVQKMLGILIRHDCFEIHNISGDDKENTLRMLQKTFKLIDNCYSEEITLKRAAQESSLSVTHFCRLFKKSTGMTFNDYLVFYRVNRAEKMLLSSKKIIDISNECGFGSVSSFLRNFKKYKYCTPSAYKDMH